MNFKVGDRVVFDVGNISQGIIMEKAMTFPFLTIKTVNEGDGYYTVKETDGRWGGRYWTLYEEPFTFDEDLFTL